MARIVSHPGLRTGRNPTPEAIADVKLPAILQGVGGWGIDEDFVGGVSAGAAGAQLATAPSRWILTAASATGTPAFKWSSGKGGLAVLDTGTGGAIHEAAQIQLDGSSFQPTAGASIYFGALLKTDAITGKMFIGLATEDTTVTDGASALAVTSHIGFWFDGANVNFSATGSDISDTTVDAVADQFIKLEFVVTGTSGAVPFVNGTRYSSSKLTTFSTSLVTPTVVKVLAATEDNKLTTVDWIKCYQNEDIVRVGSA